MRAILKDMDLLRTFNVDGEAAVKALRSKGYSDERINSAMRGYAPASSAPAGASPRAQPSASSGPAGGSQRAPPSASGLSGSVSTKPSQSPATSGPAQSPTTSAPVQSQATSVPAQSPTANTPGQSPATSAAGQSPAMSAPSQSPATTDPAQSTAMNPGGVSSEYKPITVSSAQDLVDQYGTVPGGVVLEGTSADLSFITKVTYVAKENAFILNDEIVYLNPVTRRAFSEIVQAISLDDRIAISLASGARRFGHLLPESPINWNLKLADRFLGLATFGRAASMGIASGYRWMDGHNDRPSVRENGAVYVLFRFHEYRFAKDEDGVFGRSAMKLDSTLVPVSDKKNASDKSVPDFNRIRRNEVPEAYVANLKDLQNNIDYYSRERIIRLAIGYGEAASFARAMKTKGIKLELP
jgi:hypothetical protein